MGASICLFPYRLACQMRSSSEALLWVPHCPWLSETEICGFSCGGSPAVEFTWHSIIIRFLKAYKYELALSPIVYLYLLLPFNWRLFLKKKRKGRMKNIFKMKQIIIFLIFEKSMASLACVISLTLLALLHFIRKTVTPVFLHFCSFSNLDETEEPWFYSGTKTRCAVELQEAILGQRTAR